jgi:serine/threonine protein kinase
MTFVYIDMELCDFDLDAAIQNRQLLSTTKSDAPPPNDVSGNRFGDMLSREEELECMMNMVHDVTSGLVFMHGLGEVHRDLKPHNGTLSVTLFLIRK